MDGSAQIAEGMGATVIRAGKHAGPAVARNLGASRASGDVLVFIDSDVCVHPDTVSRIAARFAAEADLDALIGSYDDNPDSRAFVSQYKNLVNHYFHQCAGREASTFWSACGAIRRDVFLAAGGFDESYARPSIEDIDLGYRLRKAGRRIALDRAIQVQHLKQWTLGLLLHSDIFERALPWTRLIVQSGRLPNALNVAVSQRISALLVCAGAVLAVAGLRMPALLAPAAAAAAGAVALNRKLFGMLAARKGWAFAAAALPLYLSYYLYSSLAFAAGALIYLPGWRPAPAVREAGSVESPSRAGAPL